MTLREQILGELNMQNEIAQEQIKELEKKIDREAFMMSTVTGGALSGAARTACQNRAQAATVKKNRIKQDNQWVSEMLSKYK